MLCLTRKGKWPEVKLNLKQSHLKKNPEQELIRSANPGPTKKWRHPSVKLFSIELLGYSQDG